MKRWALPCLAILVVSLGWMILRWNNIPPTQPVSNTGVNHGPLPREGMARSGDRWVYCYELHGQRFAVVGDRVPNKAIDAEQLQVSLDRWTTVNVPKESKYRVRLVNDQGIREVYIDPDEFPSVEGFINAVVSRE